MIAIIVLQKPMTSITVFLQANMFKTYITLAYNRMLRKKIVLPHGRSSILIFAPVIEFCMCFHLLKSRASGTNQRNNFVNYNYY